MVDKERLAARKKKEKESKKRLAELLAKNGIKKPRHEGNQGSDGKRTMEETGLCMSWRANL